MLTADQVIEKAKEYIWRQNPPAGIDSEGVEIVRLLMAKILELCGKMPPEDDIPVDKPYEEKERGQATIVSKRPHLPNHQVKMEF